MGTVSGLEVGKIPTWGVAIATTPAMEWRNGGRATGKLVREWFELTLWGPDVRRIRSLPLGGIPTTICGNQLQVVMGRCIRLLSFRMLRLNAKVQIRWFGVFNGAAT